MHVVATCNASHTEHWSSSATVGEGQNKFYEVNVLQVCASLVHTFLNLSLQATYTLLCGLNIGQVCWEYLSS